jgi:MFS family permease
LLWSSIADRHGRRAVIVASLIGSAIALIIFGTSESLPEAICVRLIQGIFGGAVGVFRGSIRDLTDDTNATRAYAVLGFSWGFGGVVGPILGGVFESPAQNFAGTFLAEIG